MKRSYITFGSVHYHEVNGQIFDNCTVCLIESDDPRQTAFDVFGRKWAFEYPEEYWDKNSLRFYPKGVIKLNIN